MRWSPRLGPSGPRSTDPKVLEAIPHRYHDPTGTTPYRTGPRDRIGPHAVDSRGIPPGGHPQAFQRYSSPMTHARHLASLLLVVVVGASAAACVAATPGWTYAPA